MNYLRRYGLLNSEKCVPFRLDLLSLLLHPGNVDSLIVFFRSTFVSSRSVTRPTFSFGGERSRRKGEVSEGVYYRLVKLTDSLMGATAESDAGHFYTRKGLDFFFLGDFYFGYTSLIVFK
jgi:hypothetical protein